MTRFEIINQLRSIIFLLGLFWTLPACVDTATLEEIAEQSNQALADNSADNAISETEESESPTESSETSTVETLESAAESAILGGAYIIVSSFDLAPECTDLRDGELLYVLGSYKFYVCTGSWIELSFDASKLLSQIECKENESVIFFPTPAIPTNRNFICSELPSCKPHEVVVYGLTQESSLSCKSTSAPLANSDGASSILSQSIDGLLGSSDCEVGDILVIRNVNGANRWVCEPKYAELQANACPSEEFLTFKIEDGLGKFSCEKPIEDDTFATVAATCSSPANKGHVLTFEEDKAGNTSVACKALPSLETLANVTCSQDSHILKYDSNQADKWVCADPFSALPNDCQADEFLTFTRNGQGLGVFDCVSIDDSFADLESACSGNDDQVLTVVGSSITCQDLPNIEDLKSVTNCSSPNNGDILKYNETSSKWECRDKYDGFPTCKSEGEGGASQKAEFLTFKNDAISCEELPDDNDSFKAISDSCSSASDGWLLERDSNASGGFKCVQPKDLELIAGVDCSAADANGDGDGFILKYDSSAQNKWKCEAQFPDLDNCNTDQYLRMVTESGVKKLKCFDLPEDNDSFDAVRQACTQDETIIEVTSVVDGKANFGCTAIPEIHQLDGVSQSGNGSCTSPGNGNILLYDGTNWTCVDQYTGIPDCNQAGQFLRFSSGDLACETPDDEDSWQDFLNNHSNCTTSTQDGWAVTVQNDGSLDCEVLPDLNTLENVSCANGNLLRYSGESWTCSSVLPNTWNACTETGITKFDGTNFSCVTNADVVDLTESVLEQANQCNQSAKILTVSVSGSTESLECKALSDISALAALDSCSGSETNHIPKYDGSNWSCVPVYEGSCSSDQIVSFDGSNFKCIDIDGSGGLVDQLIGSCTTNGQVLQVNGSGTSITCDDLPDLDGFEDLSCSNNELPQFDTSLNPDAWTCASGSDLLTTINCSANQILEVTSESPTTWSCSNNSLASLSCSNGQIAQFDTKGTGTTSDDEWVCATP